MNYPIQGYPEEVYMKKFLRGFSLILIILLLYAGLCAQEQEIQPVSVTQTMPDFTLPAYQGGTISLAELKGQNILLIFPRGLAGKDHWCHVCHYQYAELAALEKNSHFQEKYNLRVIFVLPYSKEMVSEWVEAFPAQMQDIKNWKNPGDEQLITEQQKRRRDLARTYFPKEFSYDAGNIPLPFPVLIDAERKVSRGLGLFTEEWGGSRIEQNIPTLFIIDSHGKVQFKYLSQNTLDRSSPDYLFTIKSCLLKDKK
jgi:peroxiredoxin